MYYDDEVNDKTYDPTDDLSIDEDSMSEDHEKK